MDIKSHSKLEILDNLRVGVFCVDQEKTIIYWNSAAECISGFTAAQTVGRHCSDNPLVHLDEQGMSICSRHCPLTDSLSDGKKREADVFIRHKSGHRLPVHICIVPILDKKGRIVGAIQEFSDISENVAAVKEITRLRKISLFDPLTQLGNRRFLEKALRVRQAEYHRYGRAFGVLFIDIDHVKHSS